MKADKLTTLIGVMTAVTALLSMSTGRWVIGAIIMLLAFGIFWNRGGGSINDRSIYENEIKTELEISEIYERLKDMDTPLGRAWIAVHKGFPGKSIVFGPSRFKDCIVISKKANKLNIKHITLLDNIIREPEDEYRFSDLINPDSTEVSPRVYSVFAEFKLASVMMLRHLREMIQKMTDGEDISVPDKLDMFRFYYHNSDDGSFRNADDDEVIRIENSYKPFKVKAYDHEGNELASVAARDINARGEPVISAGFDLYANGSAYGEILPYKDKSRDCYIARTDDGEFLMNLFPACRRANIACNYTIEKAGELKAAVGGSPGLIFSNGNQSQNDLVLSYDDDYIVLYAVLEIFIMTINGSFLK